MYIICKTSMHIYISYHIACILGAAVRFLHYFQALDLMAPNIPDVESPFQPWFLSGAFTHVALSLVPGR